MVREAPVLIPCMASPTLQPLANLTLPGGGRPVLRSESAKTLMRMVERVAGSPVAVLIQGETGSGKELIARALHDLSPRRNKPWIDLNCAALPEHLIESELFGHEKGAFSGADYLKIGLFELAGGGTLFLDEIGELDPRAQAKLLRVLDDVSYYRLGGTKKVEVDVRVVAATNRDLRAAAEAGKFRSDLFFRLNQIQLFVPPLRERLEDIEDIARQVLENCRPGTQLSAEALQLLRSYSWPGNIRELKNVVLSAAALLPSGSTTIGAKDLAKNIQHANVSFNEEDHTPGDLDAMERVMIERAVKENVGHQAAAADALGISRRTLTRKIKAYQLDNGGGRGGRALGSLNLGQDRYFRAVMDRPVLIRSSGWKETVESVNLSSSGIGVRNIKEPQHFDGTLDLEFSFDESAPKLTLRGQITWADSQENAGIRFVTVPRASQELIDGWIARKRTEEGWIRIP
jgi:transcriptional regulator with AAA-type ATPase domain